jgi:polyferredoxin
MTVPDKSAVLLELYKTKRTFCFLDEWAFYLLLLFLWSTGWSLWIIVGVGVYGALALITTYKNLGAIQRRLGTEDAWMFWPLAHDRKKVSIQ